MSDNKLKGLVKVLEMNFDHKHADTGKRDFTAEIFDSMNLYIK